MDRIWQLGLDTVMEDLTLMEQQHITILYFLIPILQENLHSLKTLKDYIYLKLTVISEQQRYMSGSNSTILFPVL